MKREREEDKERKPRKRINLFMNLFVQRLLRMCFVPGTVLGAGATPVNKTQGNALV